MPPDNPHGLNRTPSRAVPLVGTVKTKIIHKIKSPGQLTGAFVRLNVVFRILDKLIRSGEYHISRRRRRLRIDKRVQTYVDFIPIFNGTMRHYVERVLKDCDTTISVRCYAH